MLASNSAIGCPFEFVQSPTKHLNVVNIDFGTVAKSSSNGVSFVKQQCQETEMFRPASNHVSVIDGRHFNVNMIININSMM